MIIFHNEARIGRGDEAEDWSGVWKGAFAQFICNYSGSMGKGDFIYFGF